MNGNDICVTALQDAGILGVGENATSPMINDAFGKLNRMLSSWSADMRPVWAQLNKEYPLLANINQYSLGPTGDFVQVRPLQIVSAQLRIPNDATPIDYSLEIITNSDYQSLALKSLQGLPQTIGWNPKVPNGTLFVYPEPLQNYTLRLTTIIPLDSATLTDEYSVPPGYEQAIIANLVIILLAAYRQPSTPEQQSLAINSRLIIDRENFALNMNEATPDLTAPGYNGNNWFWWLGLTPFP